MYIDLEFAQNLLSSSDKETPGVFSVASYSEEEKKAFNKIERLVKIRDRSVYEVETRLKNDSYSSEVIASSVNRAKQCGYLDDERFVEIFTRSRLLSGKGLTGIIRDLKHNHHINPFDLTGFPDSYLPSNYDAVKAAVELLQRKPSHAKNKQQASYVKLIRNGFSSSEASQAIAIYFSHA